MTEKTRDSVRRTLILTCGSLAEAAGEVFTRHLETRHGPTTAVKVLHIEEGWEETGLATAVTEALTHISPPNLAALLAEQGWLLQDDGDIYLTLLIDARPDQANRLTTLIQQVATIIYNHLGLEPATLLLWLVGDFAETEIAACLITPAAVTRGTAVLSLRNELGLRLPDETDLSRMAADLLWCLTATPLQTLPEQIQERCGSGFTGDNFLFTVGLHGWVWSPVTAHATFVRRWLEDVLAYWTATATEPIPAEEAAAWLEANHLSGEAFAQHALLPREQQPPEFPTANSKMPWPWELQTLWEKLQFTLTIDAEALAVYRKHACLRLADPLYEAKQVLQKEAKRMMDELPIASISRTCAWLQTLMDECEQQIERTLDRDETFTETMAILIYERNTVETNLSRWLQIWPGDDWPPWLKMGLRPWRWPRLAWRYWQIQRAIGQLGIILTQQAGLQRHTIQNKIARQGLSELITTLRRVYNQVEEVGEMFSSLARQNATSPVDQEPLFHGEPPLLQITMPDEVFERLVPDAAAEATTAATAVGGLGQQITALDDTVENPLLRFGGERLAAIWQVGCAEALSARLPDDALEAHCRFAWEAACPLWRIDEARLDESHRSQSNRLTAVCGQNIHKLAAQLPGEDGPIWQLETNDQEYLWLVRVRGGLVLGN